jgi:hypothetical protein
MNIPIPPLRPTFEWTDRRWGYEIEQMVTRSISADDNWRRPFPWTFSVDVIPTHMEVLEVKFLPAGKYAIASLKFGSKYFIGVYNFDDWQVIHGAVRPMAKFQTDGRAHKLQAKYLKFHGEDGIMIQYLTRSYTRHKFYECVFGILLT